MCVDEAKDTLLPCDVPWDMRMALGSGYGWWLTLDGVSRAWNYCSPDAVHCYSCCKSNCSFPLFEFTPKFSFSYQNVFHFLSRVKTNDVLFRELISFPSLLVGTAQADESSQSVCVWRGADKGNRTPRQDRSPVAGLGELQLTPCRHCPESQLHSGQRLQPPKGKENVGKITQSSKISQIVFKKICNLKTPNSVLPWRFGKSRAEWLQQQQESSFGVRRRLAGAGCSFVCSWKREEGEEETHNSVTEWGDTTVTGNVH